jgi:hypothetical protein
VGRYFVFFNVYYCNTANSSTNEDNKLMRPFMLQPSDQFTKHYNVTGTPLGDCMARKGLNNADGWKARYACVNELSGCPNITGP